jgi:hypothetical protein
MFISVFHISIFVCFANNVLPYFGSKSDIFRPENGTIYARLPVCPTSHDTLLLVKSLYTLDMLRLPSVVCLVLSSLQ